MFLSKQAGLFVHMLELLAGSFVRGSTLGCEGGIIQGLFFPLGGSDGLTLPSL